jgi:hypothetical protein
VEREIRISNRATYWPIAPIDLMIGGPLVVRLVLGATPVGRAVQAAVFGAYLGSAIRDWRDRRGLQRIDFRREFGADLRHLMPMPREVRDAEVRTLAARLNDEFTSERRPRRDQAVEVDRHLTDYIAGITGQRVCTSVEVRGPGLVGFAMPFALGACDILSGDVAIFRDTGPFEPHIIAHEFTHRKGYWKELYAQVLAYLALIASGDATLIQSARLERLHRDLSVLADGDPVRFHTLVMGAELRPELQRALLGLKPVSGAVRGRVEAAMRGVYDRRMRVTGQNGISDYDFGFTNFLHTFENSTAARQRAPRI